MIDKMIPAFKKSEGGLFSSVSKADVGDAFANMQQQGITLMAWADPFFPNPSIPNHVKKATIEAIENGFSSHYTTPIGNLELKKEIAKKLKSYNQLEVNPERNIMITPGSDSGLFYAMLPFIHEGDEVMIIDPSYPNNFQNVEVMGGKIVRVPVYEKNDYQIDIEEFEKRLTPQTKMIVLTNPNNPTTTVYRRECLEKLADFAIKHDLVVVVDQAFEFPVFDGIEMVTLASLPNMWERTITVFSVSKGMGLSGYRVGYIVADDVIMDKMYGVAVSVLGATNTAAQLGCIAAFKDDSFLEDYKVIFEQKRDLVYEAFKDIPGVHIKKSESGFLSWLNISRLGTSEEVVDYLIKHAKAAVNVGMPYGEQGEGHIRIVHGVLGEVEELEGVVKRIADALRQLAKDKKVE